MAQNWSALTNGQNLGTIAAGTAAIINFDTGSSPSDTIVSWQGNVVTLTAQGKSVTFTITGGGRALVDTNFTFTNGSAGKIIIGDNTTGVGNATTTLDDAANSWDTSASGSKNDRFYGLGGNDTLNGGGGDDLFVLGNGSNPFGNDSVIGGTSFGGGDFIGMGSGTSTGAVIDFNTHSVTSPDGSATFSGIENAFGSSGDDQIYAFEASRVYNGRFFFGAALDFTRILDGLAGNDTLVGDQRDGLNDRVRYTGAQGAVYVNLAEEYALDGFDTDPVTSGVQGSTDTLRFIDDVQGSNFNDTLLGGGLGTAAGGFYAEGFEGMAGNDLIDGNGAQNVNFNYFSSQGGIVFDLAAGTVQDGWDSNFSLADIQSYTDTIVGGTVSTGVNGSNFGDVINGDETRNFFQGRGGNDTLDGRGGLDTAIYNYSVSPDSVAGTGVNIDLATGSSGDLSFFGLGVDTFISIEGLRGGDLNDTLRGQNNVDNELDGRAGNDLLDGRTGNDRVRYDASPNAVNVNLGTGTASDGFGNTDTLASIENLRGSKFGDTLVGSSANNGIEGFTGADSMNGSTGTGDTLEFRFSPGAVVVDLSQAGTNVVAEDGWGFKDVFAGGFENVVGGAGDDLITGNGVANRLDGNHGADSLDGGLGNDIFVVDNEGDTLTDSGGTDTVESLIDWKLTAGFERLTLLEPGSGAVVNPIGVSPAIRATGNGVANMIIGNSAANIIDGGAAADDMRGGKGNDTYIVDTSTDKVTEAAGGGVDTVKASASYSIDTGSSAHVENLILTGASAIDGSGNDRGNNIKGNGAANALDGGGGNDVLDGGAGIDQLSGGTGNDQFIWDTADTLVDGGAGSQDRLIVKGAGTTLNLNTLNGTEIFDVEVFDIRGTGNNTLSVSAETAETMGGDLTVFGNTGDVVNLNGTGVWTEGSTLISYQGHLFHVWTNDLNGAEILIETSITVNDI